MYVEHRLDLFFDILGVQNLVMTKYAEKVWKGEYHRIKLYNPKEFRVSKIYAQV
jgi:hypothetical protein